MSNVLTIEEKKKLESRARARMIFVGALMVLIGAIVASLALTPTLISISTARAALDAPSVEEESTARDNQAKAKRAQTLITALTPLLATSTPSLSLTQALELRPTGISITSITYDDAKKEIVLSGVSARREAVSTYRDALETSGFFKKVIVPVSALVGTLDGRFTITLSRL